MTAHTQTKDREIVYDFDDIEKYSFVRYRGDAGWVLDKGQHVSQTVPRARHIYIQLVDLGEDDRVDTVTMHERAVNSAIERGNLWVDWHGKLNPTN